MKETKPSTAHDPNRNGVSGSPTSAAALRGERRVVTALFCDVVDSTALAEQMDPEDWAEIMNAAFEQLSAPVRHYEGTVARLLGDALLAFFGTPLAHEDDPQRGLNAALEMQAAMELYRAELKRRHGIDFRVRIGINTGPVVVADVGAPGAKEVTALGDAVNVAARMEQTAEPGTIQVSGNTQRLVDPLFEFQALGSIELKGKSEKVPAFRLTGVKAHPGRLRGLDGVSAPLIGRDREYGLLREALERLRQGRGSIVTIIGEAGLGKSRMIAELRREWQAIDDGSETLEGRWHAMSGVPYDSMRPFGLFQNFARDTIGIEPDDPAEVIHQKVVAHIRRMGGDDDAVALCSVAFERVIAVKELHEGRAFPPEVVRKDIYDTMIPGFRHTAMSRPTVVVADDLHWADLASVDLMQHVMPLVEEVPLLLILAFRPERQTPAWQIKVQAETEFPHRYTEINLRPLDAVSTDALVSALLVIADLPKELRELILRKADGNPYFVEEIVRTLIDQQVVRQTPDGLRWVASAKVEDISIPDNLQALLMARIDRLDQETRSTLQMAAVIGRSFYYRILKAISDSAIALDKHLGSLERVELLRETSRNPELEYMFRHELARDAAYSTILNRRRREFHERVGDAMETIFADRLEEHAHRLGQHFALAGNGRKALHYYELAGDLASGVHASVESSAYYRRAVEAAETIDASADVARLNAKRATLTVASAAS